MAAAVGRLALPLCKCLFRLFVSAGGVTRRTTNFLEAAMVPSAESAAMAGVLFRWRRWLLLFRFQGEGKHLLSEDLLGQLH